MSSVSSLQFKAVALGWLRYGRRMPLVMTEVGRWNADVMGFSSALAVEVEVKTSKADLKREFQTKIAKHWLYANAKDESHVPNFFYFLVPDDMADATVALVSEAAPKAGIAVYDTTAAPLSREAVRVVKKATKLKEGPPSRQMLTAAISRCSSELVNLYQFNVDFLRRFEAEHSAHLENMLRLTARSAGTLDYEQPMDDLALRAFELAAAVEGLSYPQFLALSDQQKKKWIEAAIRFLDAQFVNARGWIDEPHLLQ